MEHLTTEELKLLVIGCSRHLPYRGTKEPKGECAACAEIYQLRQLLIKVWEIEESPMSYNGMRDLNCMYCAGSIEHTPEQHMRSATEAKRGSR